MSRSSKALPRAQWTKLPVVDLPYPLRVGESVLDATEAALRTFKGPGDGRHEGLVYWAGERVEGAALVHTVVVPRADSSPGSVHVTAAENARVISSVCTLGAQIIAQVHTHPPGCAARHSFGDDTMILTPFNGMLSLIVPDYAVDALRPIETIGFHVYTCGAWHAVSPASVRRSVLVLPDRLDLR